MADDGFDFHKPQRKEARRFEPPPWEKEAFEELERRKAEEERAQAELAAAEQTASTEAMREEGAEPSGSDAAVPPEQAAGSTPVAEDDATADGDEATQPAGQKPALEEARVTEMLAELSAQEPREQEGLWTIAMGAAIVIGAIGGVLIVWAMAALVGARRSGFTGIAGGLVLLVFGAGFVSGALWIAYRTLRQRGVL